MCVLVSSVQIKYLLQPLDGDTNPIICMIIHLVPFLVLYGSLLSFCGLSAERCITVYYPFYHQKWITKKTMAVFLVVVWPASFSPLYGVTGSAGRIVTMPGCKLVVFRSTSILLLLYSVCIPVLLTTITLYWLIVKAAMNLLTYTCFSTCHHFHRSPTEECTNTALDWFLVLS